ncbi:efflux RND transporter permease subunit [Alteromonas gilva]|uniref:Efflux RND transporter permease subunit n=1 Tax=Alteromonas gilva TaxID=2987522 RepID=A0ABT5L640_9ALTE|nr:efflux RND transporter permease subunit [Alteromonas gilva]MDC8831233.1 efflux RND transporter permease subunit [Alteromonas gilva]
MQLVDIAVKRPVAIGMFTLAVLLFGMVSLGRLSVNLLPELAYPTLTIRTDYNGAAPAEVEQLVSKPIEETIGTVKGVRSVKSVSRPGQSDIVLEFAWGTEMDFASLEVREKLDILQLPLDVDKPRLLRFNPSLDPILRYGLSFSSPDASAAAMKRLRVYAEEQVKRQLESIEGVASVKIGGALENEIQVLVDQRRVSQLNINVNDIIRRLKEENLNAAGGRIDNGNQAFLVRTLNQFNAINEIGDLYIANREGKSIRLRDVATIENAYKERDAISRFNGQEGAEIAIYKEGDANSVDVARLVTQALTRITQELPADYQLNKVYDQSEFIKQAIDDVKSSAVIGGILAMLILYLFLRDFWPTLIISISIPLSVIATFNLMYGNDISLNIMSLGGIALAVGLLVDNSIVVLENIDKHKQRSKGLIDTAQAAANGTKEVSSAILASTLTTLAVFVPLIFVEGIAGQLFSDQAMTVSFALVASLIVALTVIPALAAKATRKDTFTENSDFEPAPAAPREGWRKGMYYLTLPLRLLVKLVFGIVPMLLTTAVITLWRGVGKVLAIILLPLTTLFNLGFSALEKLYKVSLAAALNARWLVLGGAVAATAFAYLLIPRLGMELIPRMSQGEFFIEVTLPAGSRVEQTDNLLTRLAGFTDSLPQVARTYSLAGTGSLISAAPSQGGDHWGKLNVVLKDDTSDADEQQVKQSLREFLARQAGVQSKFGYPELFTFAAPIQIELQGYDLNQLQRFSDELKGGLEANDRFADVTSSLRIGNPELKINFNHAALARLDMDAATAAKLVAAQIGGEVATQYSLRDRKVDILVRTEQTQRDQIEDIGRIIVNPGSDQAIPLHAVADVYLSNGPSEITRIGQQRVALIEANLRYGDLAQGVAAAQQIIDNTQLPLSLKATIAGQSEDMQQSFDSLLLALALAIFMVYLVMASQFESLGHPLLILFAIPMAVAGAIYGLLVTNTHVSVVVFIGLIMLCGIVVNNAIVLIDRINQLREQGQDKHSAIVTAAHTRLRPIIMTTLTTILGLLPMAIGFGEGAEVRTPMAVTVIFGLLFSTVLTLILLPVIYSLFDRKQFKAVSQGSEEHVYG